MICKHNDKKWKITVRRAPPLVERFVLFPHFYLFSMARKTELKIGVIQWFALRPSYGNKITGSHHDLCIFWYNCPWERRADGLHTQIWMCTVAVRGVLRSGILVQLPVSPVNLPPLHLHRGCVGVWRWESKPTTAAAQPQTPVKICLLQLYTLNEHPDSTTKLRAFYLVNNETHSLFLLQLKLPVISVGIKIRVRTKVFQFHYNYTYCHNGTNCIIFLVIQIATLALLLMEQYKGTFASKEHPFVHYHIYFGHLVTLRQKAGFVIATRVSKLQHKFSSVLTFSKCQREGRTKKKWRQTKSKATKGKLKLVGSCSCRLSSLGTWSSLQGCCRAGDEKGGTVAYAQVLTPGSAVCLWHQTATSKIPSLLLVICFRQI